jgi:antitoxin CptB
MTSDSALPIPDDNKTLEVLRRRVRFRAWHRGTSEADLLLGAFADLRLGEFVADELNLFDRLLDVDDPVIEDWIRGRQFIPKQHDNKVLASLRLFCLADRALRRER